MESYEVPRCIKCERKLEHSIEYYFDNSEPGNVIATCNHCGYKANVEQINGSFYLVNDEVKQHPVCPHCNFESGYTYFDFLFGQLDTKRTKITLHCPACSLIYFVVKDEEKFKTIKRSEYNEWKR